MCICLCIRTYTYTNIYTYVYTYTYTHVYKVGIQSLASAKSIVSLWRACNLTSFSQCLTGPAVDYLFASCHKGPAFKSPGGYLCETGIFLLALSRYIDDPDIFRSLTSSPFRCFNRLRADNVQASRFITPKVLH
jgi:hypothetical protein